MSIYVRTPDDKPAISTGIGLVIIDPDHWEQLAKHEAAGTAPSEPIPFWGPEQENQYSTLFEADRAARRTPTATKQTQAKPTPRATRTASPKAMDRAKALRAQNPGMSDIEALKRIQAEDPETFRRFQRGEDV